LSVVWIAANTGKIKKKHSINDITIYDLFSTNSVTNMTHTHHLHIRLLDIHENKFVEDDTAISHIKNYLSMPHTHLLLVDDHQRVACTIEWKKIERNAIDHFFMGDMVCHPLYRSDDLVYEHTLHSIGNIQKIYTNYKIYFHLSIPILRPVGLKDF